MALFSIILAFWILVSNVSAKKNDNTFCVYDICYGDKIDQVEKLGYKNPQKDGDDFFVRDKKFIDGTITINHSVILRNKKKEVCQQVIKIHFKKWNKVVMTNLLRTITGVKVNLPDRIVKKYEEGKILAKEKTFLFYDISNASMLTLFYPSRCKVKEVWDETFLPIEKSYDF